jgi:hypothetical protein
MSGIWNGITYNKKQGLFLDKKVKFNEAMHKDRIMAAE